MKKIQGFLNSISVLLKKDVKLYSSKIISLLLLLVLLTASVVAALGAMLLNNFGDEKDTLLRMAIYDVEPSAITKNAVAVLSRTETVKELFTVEFCESEDEARSGVENGNYDAALIFSKGYYRKILEGDASAITVIVSDKLKTVTSLVNNFAETGELIIVYAEAGVEGVRPAVKEMFPKDARTIINNMEVSFAFDLFSIPTECFAKEVLPYSGTGVDKVEFYFVCYLAFLLLFTEVIFFSYTSKDCEFSMLRRIKSYRISSLSIVVQKSLIPFFVRTVLFFGVLAAIQSFIEIDFSAVNIIMALLCLFLISTVMTAITILLSQTPLGISVIFALCAGSLVLAGGIMPQSMLPYEVSVISSFLPLYPCIQMLAPLFCGNMSVTALIYLAFLAVALTVAACMYQKRICKGGGIR